LKKKEKEIRSKRIYKKEGGDEIHDGLRKDRRSLRKARF